MYKEKHILNHHTAGHTLSRYLDVYELDTIYCSADKTTGYKGDTITITGTPAWNEKTSSYSVTGATLTGNQFDFTGSDVTAQANYETAKNVTLQATDGGSIAANRVSGFIGDSVTLSNTAFDGYEFSAYTLTGANLTGNTFNFTGSDVTAKAWFNYVSPTKHARIAMRFADIAPTIASAGKTFYPFVIMQDLYVTGSTGDNIDSLLANHRVAKAQYYAYPLWNNGDTSTASADTTARSINFDLVDTVHLYANTGTTTAGAYEIRGRCNVNNEYVALKQYIFSSSQTSAHQVNTRNIQDSNNLWIYGRGQGIPEDFTVAGSALYNDALYKCLIPVQVAYWYNSTAMCAPNPIVQHTDIIADITWTE